MVIIQLKAGHHRPASETPWMAFRLLADDGPTLNAGLVLQGVWTSIDNNYYIFCDFSPYPLWIRACFLFD